MATAIKRIQDTASLFLVSTYIRQIHPARSTSVINTSLMRSSAFNGCGLRVPQHIQYKLAILAYKVLRVVAPSYLGLLVRVADLPGRRALRSSGSNCLVAPSVKLSIVDSRVFPVAAAQLWNSLPGCLLADSLSTFRLQLKHCLFQQSYPDAVYTVNVARLCYCDTLSGSSRGNSYLGRYY